MDTTAADDIILALISRCGVIRGKKVFQKLCYFLQEAEGARMGLRYRMKHYGPFSEELDDRLEDLAESGLVSVHEQDDGSFVIKPGQNLPETQGTSASSEEIDRLLSNLGSQMDHGLTLEALATAHFLADSKWYEGSEENKAALVERVRAWKGRKFDEDFIRQNVSQLEEIGYLPVG